MLDYTEQRRVVESYIKDNFATCAIKFENLPLPAVDGKGPTSYIAIFDKPSFAESTGMGEVTAHKGGTTIIQIFVPLNTGTALTRSIAQELADLLENKVVGGISYDVSELHPAPKSDSWYQSNLQIPYVMISGQEPYCT